MLKKYFNFKLISLCLCFLLALNTFSCINVKALTEDNVENIKLSLDNKNTTVTFKKNLYTNVDIPTAEYIPNSSVELFPQPYFIETVIGYVGYEVIIGIIAVLGLTLNWDSVQQGGAVALEVIKNLSVETLNALKSGIDMAKGTVTLSKEAIKDIQEVYRIYVLEKAVNTNTISTTTINSSISAINNFQFVTLDISGNNTVNLPDMLRQYSIGSSITFTDSSTGIANNISMVLDSKGQFAFSVNGAMDNMYNTIKVGGVNLSANTAYFNVNRTPFPNVYGQAEAFLVPVISNGKTYIYGLADISFNGKAILGYIGFLDLSPITTVQAGTATIPTSKDKDVIGNISDSLVGPGDVTISGVNTGSVADSITSTPTIGDVVGGVVNSISSLWDALAELLKGLLGSLLESIEWLLNGLLNGLESLLGLLLAPFIKALNGVLDMVSSIKNWIKDFVDNKLKDFNLPRLDLFLLYIILIVYRIIMLLIAFYQYCFVLYRPSTFSMVRPEYLPPAVADAVDFLHNAKPIETDIEWVNTMASGGINLGLSFMDFVNLIVGFFLVIKIIKIVRGKVSSNGDIYDNYMEQKARDEQNVISKLTGEGIEDKFYRKYGHGVTKHKGGKD